MSHKQSLCSQWDYLFVSVSNLVTCITRNLAGANQDCIFFIYFQCNQCNKSFKTQTYLKQHKIRCHSSRKATVECPLCDKRFKWQVSLKYHLRFHKQGYHECSECEKKFQFEESKSLRIIPSYLSSQHSHKEITDYIVGITQVEF